MLKSLSNNQLLVRSFLVFVSFPSGRKSIAILFASIVLLVPVMNGILLAPVSSPTGMVYGPGTHDFTISSSPSTLTLVAGASGTTTVTVTSINSLAGLVLLSTSTFGLDASLDKENVTLSSGGSA